MRAPRRFLSALLILALAGVACDQPPPPPQRTVSPAVVLQPLMYLRADCRTLLAPGAGVTFVAQVVDDAQQRVQMIDNAGVPHDTAFTGPRIAQALGVTNGRAGIRAMAAVTGGNLLVYVNGLTRTQSMASLWLWNPSTDNLKLVAGQEDLGQASGMGVSIDLADATLVRAGQSVWLVLRHLDATRCLQINVRDLTFTGTARLARPFESIRTGEGEVVHMADEDVVYGRGDGSLWLLQRETGLTSRIGTDGRLQSPEPTPPDRPRPLAPPLDLNDPSQVAGPEAQRRLIFWPHDGPHADPLMSPVLVDESTRRYPCFEFVGPRPASIYRDAITVRPAFPVHALRITTWCIEPTSGAIIAYDAMSGELLRLHASGV